MTDWKSIAAAMQVETNERAVATLEALEKAFKHMTARLAPDDDIAVDYAAALAGEDAR
jgi:hypothetical protein